MSIPAPGPNTENNTDNRNVYTMRGQYLLTPNDKVSFWRSAIIRSATSHAAAPFKRPTVPFTASSMRWPRSRSSAAPRRHRYRQPAAVASSRNAYSNQPVTQQIRDMGISGQLDWDLGFGKLTSITAWRDNTLIAGNDFDYTAVDIVQEPANEGNLVDFKQTSEEMRLAGKMARSIGWWAGFSRANPGVEHGHLCRQRFRSVPERPLLGGSGTAELSP
jgi:iron complex outermembrane receptor protein